MIPLLRTTAVLAALLLLSTTALAADFEQEPIRYSNSTPKNVITRLQEQLDQGHVRLPYDAKFGYLPAVLATLKVPASSQGLVFSKTSLQRQRIAPKTPRAIYFNDDVYIGYCQHGDLLEVSTADPVLGAVFYTLSQDESVQPAFKRQTDNCLIRLAFFLGGANGYWTRGRATPRSSKAWLCSAVGRASMWNVRVGASGSAISLIVSVPRFAMRSCQAMIGVPSTACRFLIFSAAAFDGSTGRTIEVRVRASG